MFLIVNKVLYTLAFLGALGLEFCAKAILFCMGWNMISEFDLKTITDDEIGFIGLYCHTSYWDIVMLALYRMAYFRYMSTYFKGYSKNRGFIITRPQDYKYFGKIMDYLGMIPATRREESRMNFVATAAAKIKAEMKLQMEKDKERTGIIVLIAPEGSRDAHDWRSGYYYLAKELNLPIRIIGVDFEHKNVVVYIKKDYNKLLLDEMQRIMKREMAFMVPLYPENTVVYRQMRDYNKHNVSLVDPITFSMFLCSSVALFTLFSSEEYLLGFLCFISCFISMIYHHGKEKHNMWQSLDSESAYLFITVYIAIIIYRGLSFRFLELKNILHLLCTILMYNMGHGRNCEHPRTKEYLVFHTLFHVFGVIALCYPFFL